MKIVKKFQNNPLISIITVVYNGDKHLRQTINSVISQTYKNIEYIIIDGGSTDNTLKIIKEFEHDISYWVSESDKGLYDAMNKGVKFAKGELIGMINSDDWYEKNAVETIVQAFINNPNKSIFHGDMFLIGTNKQKVIRHFNPSKFKFKYYGMTYAHPTFFVTRHIYNKFQYNINLKTISDYQFALEVFYDNPSVYFYINIPYANYRFGGVSNIISSNQLLKDGFIARNNAGMNFFLNIFSLLLRAIVFKIYRIKNNK